MGIDDIVVQPRLEGINRSPPVRRDPTRLCDTCKKTCPKKQFDADQWAHPHSRCKACVREVVRKMDDEQRKKYQDPMAEAIRLSQEAYAQINTSVAVDDAATEVCPICLEDKLIVELTKPWGCHGFCRDCGSEAFAKFRNCPRCRKFKFNAASAPFVPACN